jgi:hypothetical protein
LHELAAGHPLASNIIEFHPFEGPTDDDHDIDSWHPELTGCAERLADEPLGAITDDGVSDPARCDDPEPRFPRRGPCVQEEHEVGENRLPAATLSGFELEPFLDSLRGRKTTDGARTRHYFL